MDLFGSTTILATLVSFLLLAVAHFVSLRAWGSLHRLACYGLGVGLIFVVFGAWCLANDLPGAIAGLAAIAGGAGAGTLFGYLVEWVGSRREGMTHQLEALRRQVALMERQLGERDGAGPDS